MGSGQKPPGTKMKLLLDVDLNDNLDTTKITTQLHSRDEK